MNRPLAAKESTTGRCAQAEGPAWLDQARWFEAVDRGDGRTLEFPAGTLSSTAWLSFDILLKGSESPKFCVALREQSDGPAFHFTFAVLPMIQARARIALASTDLNRWMYDREGAFLKPLTGGARVDPTRVTRVELTVAAKGDSKVLWCMTDIRVTRDPPPLLSAPFMPSRPLLDELGQSTLHSWKGRTRSTDDVTARLQIQRRQSSAMKWPSSFSRWGGWNEHGFEPSGFFRTHHDGNRWWLVDPDGHPFWSAGIDCVRAEVTTHCKNIEDALADRSIVTHGSANFLAANFRRAFGESIWHEAWTDVTLAHLREFGFNTIANWSEWEIGAKAGFPYVRPLHWQRERATKDIFRDFPDVFHPDYERDCAAFADPLARTVTDAAMVGYFMMNEPTWGFADQIPAEGMLYNTETCATRVHFAAWLKNKYGDDNAFRKAWRSGVGLDSIEHGRLETLRPTSEARKDLEAFSTAMTETLFGGLSRACRRVDPNHLNLGARYHTVPPEWAMKGMTCFDVFSINCYIVPRVRREIAVATERMSCPVLIGEWHFGAFDAGLPATGIGRVRTQADRGKAYRIYCEDAAAQPWCVGAHWFTLYDQSALGRFDGECYNIGFLDVCNKPYKALCAEARKSHEALYAIASGSSNPFGDEPE